MSAAFLDLGVRADYVKALDEMGIVKPMPVQREAIPYLLSEGGDFVAQAQTGTGKTVAFGLPLLAGIKTNADFKGRVQGLVVAPTRELAKQIGKELFKLTKYVPREKQVFCEVLSGGEPIDRQVKSLKRPTQLVVGTPGRILELVRMKALDLSRVKRLVLDEGDEMLSMGFKKELSQIFEFTKQRESTWLFSATYPESLQQLEKTCLKPDPKRLMLGAGGREVNEDIEHKYAVVEKGDKVTFVRDFIYRQGEERGIVFVRTKAGAIALGKQLEEYDLEVGVLQGDLSQKERDKVMRAFRKERLRVLITTDATARGIDVEGLEYVLHHQPPEHMEYYTHRSGRTGRAGCSGTSIVMIEPRERKRLKGIESALGIEFEEYYSF